MPHEHTIMDAAFGLPSSIISSDHQDSDGSSQNATDPGIPMQDIHTPDDLQSQSTDPGRQRSSSSSSEDTVRGSGEVDVDPSRPPVISHPSNHANIKKRPKFKPYQRPQASSPSKANAPSQANALPQANAPSQVDDDPIIAGLIFAEKFMGEYPNTDYIIDDILEAKELFERGMENVPDGVIVEAIFTKLADRKAKNARALASLWEAEAIERHGVLLHKLRKANAQMYADNPAEASRIESVLVRCSVKELQDDLEASNLAYCYDKGAAAVADLHFEVLKELAASRNLNLSGKRSKDALQAKLVEGGNSSKSKSSDG